jgi:hypothetical protein
MGRYDRLRRIEGLDPKDDHVEIYHLMCGYEFPWDMTRALEVARYRTYYVPSISNFFTDRKNRSYPFGYEIERLGPPDLNQRS